MNNSEQHHYYLFLDADLAKDTGEVLEASAKIARADFLIKTLGNIEQSENPTDVQGNSFDFTEVKQTIANRVQKSMLLVFRFRSAPKPDEIDTEKHLLFIETPYSVIKSRIEWANEARKEEVLAKGFIGIGDGINDPTVQQLISILKEEHTWEQTRESNEED